MRPTPSAHNLPILGGGLLGQQLAKVTAGHGRSEKLALTLTSDAVEAEGYPGRQFEGHDCPES